MSFNPDDYPEVYPAQWYETYTGKIVGHVSLLRDMIKQDFSHFPDFVVPENLVPRINFTLGSWIDGEWVDGVSSGRGILLGLDEKVIIPRVLLGDYVVLEELPNCPNESVIVETFDFVDVPLDQIGILYGALLPPDKWMTD